MAPRTTTPRLRTIDPARLAGEVCEAVSAHVERLCFDVGLGTRKIGVNNLLHSVVDLARYACLGARLDAPVPEYLLSVAPAVWMRAADGGTFHTPEFDAWSVSPDEVEGSWVGRLVVVMRAALAREALDRGLEPLNPAELAVLGSVTSTHVRHLIRSGEIAAVDTGERWEIDPAEARRWLCARGVAGFGEG